jgi:anti-sigma factor RsiW
MRPESLEALLLDYALGQLSPEVAELMEGHLAQSPEAAKQAHGLASTLQLARQATTVTLEAPQRPLALERLRGARVTNRRRVVIWEWVRLAACVLIGLTLGWYGHIVRKPTTAPAFVPMAAATAAPSNPRENTGDIWSIANFEEARRDRRAVESRTISRYQPNWDFPSRMPQMEENL